MAKYFNRFAGDAVQTDIMNMVWGFEKFLDRHTGKVPPDATEDEMGRYLIDEVGLVCNELHYLDKGGNGTPSGTCTSEAQSFHILGYIWLYKATGNPYFLERAKYFWQAYFDILYLGKPLPADDKQVLHCHWMINVKREFPSAYPNNFVDGGAAGFLGEPMTFTNNVCYVPKDQVYFGNLLQVVKQAFPMDHQLVWDAVDADIATDDWEDGKAYEVAGYINHQGWNLDTDGDRIDDVQYPDSEIGRITLSGKVYEEYVGGPVQLPDENVNGQLRVCFATHNGQIIRQKEAFDPRPIWAPLAPGTEGNAADGEEWFCDASYLLWEITGEEKYRIMWRTAQNTCLSYCAIDSSLRIFRNDPLAESPFTDGISFSYSFPDTPLPILSRVQDPNDTFYGCIKIDCTLAGNSPIDNQHSTWMENSGTWYKVDAQSYFSWELACSQGLSDLELEYSFTASSIKDDSGATSVYRSPGFEKQVSNLSGGVLRSIQEPIYGSTTVTGDAPFLANCYFNTTIGSTDWKRITNMGEGQPAQYYQTWQWIGSTEPGTECWFNISEIIDRFANGIQTFEVHRFAADNYDYSRFIIEIQTKIGTYGFRLNRIPDEALNSIYSFDLSLVGSTVDHDIRAWYLWDDVSRTWIELDAINGNPVNDRAISGMAISVFDELSTSERPTGVGFVGFDNFREQWWDPVKEPFILRNALEYRVTGAESVNPIIYMGNCFIGNPVTDNLAYTPGLVPFSNNWDPAANAYSAWRGMPYMGYQYPFVFRDVPDHWENIVRVLYDAQQDYPNGAPNRPLGPSRAAYVWNRSDNTGYGPVDTFVDLFWGDSEPWDGYQPRITWAVGRAYYDQVVVRKETADPRLVTMMDNWITFLADFLRANSGEFPTGFISTGKPYDDGWNGHMVANYMTGVCLAAIAGHQHTDIDFVIESAMATFKREYYVETGNGSNRMNGCWSSYPQGNQFFGFWAGNIYQGFGTYLMYHNWKQGKPNF